jgi:DNA-binding NarL/FixJ family response regulator
LPSIVRSGIQAFPSLEADIVLAGEAADGREAVAAYARHSRDVVRALCAGACGYPLEDMPRDDAMHIG